MSTPDQDQDQNQNLLLCSHVFQVTSNRSRKGLNQREAGPSPLRDVGGNLKGVMILVPFSERVRSPGTVEKDCGFPAFPGAGRTAQGVMMFATERDNLSEFSLQNPEGARRTNS